eukprot:3937161-Rhodomonas_salina.3
MFCNAPRAATAALDWERDEEGRARGSWRRKGRAWGGGCVLPLCAMCLTQCLTPPPFSLSLALAQCSLCLCLCLYLSLSLSLSRSLAQYYPSLARCSALPDAPWTYTKLPSPPTPPTTNSPHTSFCTMLCTHPLLRSSNPSILLLNNPSRSRASARARARSRPPPQWGCPASPRRSPATCPPPSASRRLSSITQAREIGCLRPGALKRRCASKARMHASNGKGEENSLKETENKVPRKKEQKKERGKEVTCRSCGRGPRGGAAPPPPPR